MLRKRNSIDFPTFLRRISLAEVQGFQAEMEKSLALQPNLMTNMGTTLDNRYA